MSLQHLCLSLDVKCLDPHCVMWSLFPSIKKENLIGIQRDDRSPVCDKKNVISKCGGEESVSERCVSCSAGLSLTWQFAKPLKPTLHHNSVVLTLSMTGSCTAQPSLSKQYGTTLATAEMLHPEWILCRISFYFPWVPSTPSFRLAFERKHTTE